jgi:aspartate 1-decarboxylase
MLREGVEATGEDQHGDRAVGAKHTKEADMRRRMMKSKIHRARVTDANLHYVGSITLDSALMELADIRENEQVHVLDLDNGARFETYAIAGGPGDVCLNGAAARLVQPGDRVIVIAYADYDEAELDQFEPRVVHVDTANRPVARELAQQLAASDAPGSVRYVEIDAGLASIG